jgi:hypothetical protein
MRARAAASASAHDRLRRVHSLRARALRELGVEVPASILERHPRDLAWRVSVMDRWIGRHLDLAGGRRLPPWNDPDEEDHDDDDRDDCERDDRDDRDEDHEIPLAGPA